MAIEFLKKTFFSFDADEVCSGFSMFSSSFCQRFTCMFLLLKLHLVCIMVNDFSVSAYILIHRVAHWLGWVMA